MIEVLNDNELQEMSKESLRLEIEEILDRIGRYDDYADRVETGDKDDLVILYDTITGLING